jgi:hypothetical protein
LTNIQRTIAKFDALHPRLEPVHSRHRSEVEAGIVPSRRTGKGKS